MIVPAVEQARANPIPDDLDDAPSFYLGDTLALAAAHNILFKKPWWQDDPSDCGRVLRDIASVLIGWGDRPKDPPESDAKERFHARLQWDRSALTTISWLLAGKTMEESRRMSGRG